MMNNDHEKLDKDMREIRNHVAGLERRFDDHLKVYSENGKAMTKLASAVEGNSKDLRKLTESIDEYITSNKEDIEWLKNIRWGKKALLVFAGFVATVVGIAVGITRL